MADPQPIRVAVEFAKAQSPDVLQLLSGLLTPLIAIATMYIAYQQYLLAKLKFRHDSYERRLQVYKSVQAFISEIVRKGKTDYSNCSQFYAEASEATFLFAPAVQEYIEEIYKKALELVELYERMCPPGGGEGVQGQERGQAATDTRELKGWFIKQLSASKEIFRGQMGIE